MQADNTQDIPDKFRSSGDGRFLYRFRGRDYLLTREQALRQIKLFQKSAITIVALFALVVIFVVARFLAVETLGPPWRELPSTLFLILCLVWLLGFYWRTAASLKDCDYRAVPKAKGMVARGLQWLEYNRSIYVGDNPPPSHLFVYCMFPVVIFVSSMSRSWSRLAERDGLAFAVEAFYSLTISALCLGFFAVLFYAFCRAIARNKANGSGSDRPSSN